MTIADSPPKIAILCLPGLQSFLSEIVSWLGTRYQVRTCYSDDPQTIAATVAWADVIWLEWANALAVGLTRNAALLEGKHVICRLHSYEAFGEDLTAIEWSRIDELICVAPHILEIVEARVPDLARRCGRVSIIPNGIDVDSLSYAERRKGFHLAYLGYINYKKGPMLLLQVLKQLVCIDPRYHLTIGGKMQDLRFKHYFEQMIPAMGLTPHIHFDGWIGDVNGWLADKDYILCTSVLESQGLGLMEAMGCGIKPVIHNFVGARDIYPHQNLWNTVQEAVDLILSDEYDSTAYRRWIAERYGLAEQLFKVEKVVTKNQVLETHRIEPSTSVELYSQAEITSRPTTKSLQSPPFHPQVGKMLQACVQPGMRVLDLGCGTGAPARFMGERGAIVTGVDVSEVAITAARQHNAHENVDYQQVAYEQMQLPAAFDLIVVVNTLHRIEKSALDAFVETIARHVSPKAVVYLTVMDGRYLQFMQDKQAAAIDPPPVGHPPESILAAFAGVGFHAYHVNFYGDAAPLEYNEFLFTTQTAFHQTFESASR